jgi:TolB-like protein
VEFDHALNTAVKKIRIALGDCATSPCYIETIPKRGYRFVAPVKVGPVHGGELFSAVGRPRRTVRGLTSLRSWSGSPLHVALAATILLSVVFLGMRWRAASPHLREEHIAMAVLPLEDWSHDSSGMSLCDGISEELVTELGRVEPSRLTVAPRALTLPYRHTSKTVAEVAHDLHANYLLEGNLRGDGHHVRVTVELIRVRDQARIWGDNFDREAGDPLALESEIAAAIAVKVKPVLLAGMARDR